MILINTGVSVHFELVQWFPKWAVRNSRGRWSRNRRLGGGEAEMVGWGAIGDPVNN